MKAFHRASNTANYGPLRVAEGPGLRHERQSLDPASNVVFSLCGNPSNKGKKKSRTLRILFKKRQGAAGARTRIFISSRIESRSGFFNQNIPYLATATALNGGTAPFHERLTTYQMLNRRSIMDSNTHTARSHANKSLLVIGCCARSPLSVALEFYGRHRAQTKPRLARLRPSGKSSTSPGLD